MRNISILLISLSIIIIAIFSFTYSSNTNEQPQKSYLENYKSDYKIYSPPLPKNIDFAGESTPINIFFVSEKLEKEILKNTFWHSNTLLIFKRANRWFPVIEPILAKNDIPNDFKYLAVIESGLTQVVSPAGARGFWQFMRTTAKGYNLRVTKEIDERYHVEKSTQAACDYLNEAYEIFGNWTLVAASYNLGMGGIKKQMSVQKVESYYDLSLNSETGRYVYRILALKTIFENPAKYGFQLREADLFPPLETYTLETDSANINWADFAKENKVSYAMLKTLNPWLRRSTLSNSSKIKYEIKLPSENLSNYQKMKHKLSEVLGVFGDSK